MRRIEREVCGCGWMRRIEWRGLWDGWRGLWVGCGGDWRGMVVGWAGAKSEASSGARGARRNMMRWGESGGVPVWYVVWEHATQESMGRLGTRVLRYLDDPKC